MLKHPRSPRGSLVLAIGVALTSLFASHARAQDWPPPVSATNLSDPKYWPNDPDYAYHEDPTTHDISNGQWNYYSFIPTISTSVRPEEKASGMSIDLAWRYTTGDSEVVLAITDSGIQWEEPDLIDKVYLNMGELMKHKPRHADNSACGGVGPLEGFDCNGDGLFTVSDYVDTPELKPDADATHVKGDMNGNGVLDAGDLILNFSDGKDDDGNGYIDDIAGWDFMKDDNDPYDDTRYGHGSGEANDSTAQANNGISGAGVCPKCRFLPMRVGDSFITDSTSFGKAVVYATDNGASIIQCALGTINMNRFAHSALDYAYYKGVLAITSMADENSRHHNMPAASNHTLPVHAIEYDQGDIAHATTFLAYHPCSNFGGQNFLSASAASCSSEATGKLSGIAGLVISEARARKLDPPLSPGEAQGILITTADDIDVPESEKPGSPYHWSQKGFDQRFGYGRANANSAVVAVREGRIPPAVDVVSPTWFSVLYKDQVTASIEIQGSVSAKRAQSYDYVVEWAPGVQPLDDLFKPIYQTKSSLNAKVVTDGVLARWDIRSVDPTHPRDVDSPNGENDTAVTVRVRAVAHYGGSIGDVAGQMRRTYYIQKDPSLVKGFPIYLGESGELSPKMADIDGDGVKDLIVPTSGGVLHVLKMTPDGPVPVKGFPFYAKVEDGLLETPPTPTTPSYLSAPGYQPNPNPRLRVDPSLGGEAFGMAPAIADLDGDGKPEIVVSTYPGSIYVIGSDGKVKPGFPVRLPLVPSCPVNPNAKQPDPCMSTTERIGRGAFAAPVLADMDGDGKLDIIQAAFDGKVYVFDHLGHLKDGWPVSIHYTGKLAAEPNRNRILTTPAVADFNGDGIPDLLVGSNEQVGESGGAGAMYLIDGRGNNAPKLTLPNWPVTMTSLDLFPLVAEGIPNAGVVGTMQGKLVAAMHGNASSPLILPGDPGAQTLLGSLPSHALPGSRPDPDFPGQTLQGLDPLSKFGPLTKAAGFNTMFPLFAQPSLGDIDQDGVPDLVVSGSSLAVAISLASSSAPTSPPEHLMAIWSGKTGAMMPGSPMLLEDFSFFNSHAIVDLNGDDYPEVIAGSGGYFLHAFDGCGREPDGWPKFTGQWIIPTPVVGDMDGDGKLEVAVATRDGWLYAWHTEATTDSIIEWESFHHDNRNTGNYDVPLDQGGKHKASTPLTVDICSPPPGMTPPELRAGGGCDCRLAEERDGSPAAYAVGVMLVASAFGRRRRRGARRAQN